MTASLTLYDDALDERCYAVRLMLALLRVEPRIVGVDVYPGREQLTPALLALNPGGALPILRDGALVLTGTGTILAYLARRFDPAGSWFPGEPELFGQVQMWLEFAATDLLPAHRARLASLFGALDSVAPLRRAARAALRLADDAIIRRQLGGSEWFVGDRATLADLAVFPAFALSRDFGIDHGEFDGLRRWARRVRALAGFITMPGIPSQ